MKLVNKYRGFTLIELLVVVAIIGFLASIVLASLNEARAKARDAVRIHDMAQIHRALELFYDDHGRYPDRPNDGICAYGNYIGIGNAIDTALAPYLGEVPQDPLHDGVNYFYSYDPGHCNAPSSGEQVTTFGFHNAETKDNLRHDAYCGAAQGVDMKQYQADYVIALEPMAAITSGTTNCGFTIPIP